MKKFNQAIAFLLLNIVWSYPSLAEEIEFWNGKNYSTNSTPQLSQARDLIRQIPFKGTESILDFGCGDGKITLEISHLLNRGGSILGIDTSQSMIGTALDALEKEGSTNASFAMDDILKMKYEDQFDVIVSFSTFHWIANQELALAQIRRALKPGGKVYLLFNGDHGKIAPLDESIDKVTASARWQAYLKNARPGLLSRKSTPKDLTDMVANVNLILNRMEVRNLHERFPGRDSLSLWMRGWMSSLVDIPKEKRSIYLDEIMDDYFKKIKIAEDGSFIFSEYIFQLELEKPLDK